MEGATGRVALCTPDPELFPVRRIRWAVALWLSLGVYDVVRSAILSPQTIMPHLVISFCFGLFVAAGLWEQKSWARFFVTGISWAGLVVLLLRDVFGYLPFIGRVEWHVVNTMPWGLIDAAYEYGTCLALIVIMHSCWRVGLREDSFVRGPRSLDPDTSLASSEGKP